MPPYLPSDQASARELSFRTFGNDGTSEGRRKRIAERASDSRAAVAAKRRRESKLWPDQIATFLTETYLRLQGLAARQMRDGRIDAPRANAILFNTVRIKSSGFVAIAPNADSAAFLAAWLRSPGVDAFCPALEQLDFIAGAPAPAGKPVTLSVPDLVGSLAALEKSGIGDAVAAARHLRTAGTFGSHARFYATPEAAAPIADTLHALGLSRVVVNSLDQIAGRTEPRPH